MAGTGWRQYTAGAVLTAAQVQNYLQDQVIQVYTNSAARSSALGTVVSQGMVSFLTATNQTQYYDGAAWQDLGATSGFDGFMLMGA